MLVEKLDKVKVEMFSETFLHFMPIPRSAGAIARLAWPSFVHRNYCNCSADSDCGAGVVSSDYLKNLKRLHNAKIRIPARNLIMQHFAQVHKALVTLIHSHCSAQHGCGNLMWNSC